MMVTKSSLALSGGIKDKLLSGISETAIKEALKKENVNIYKRDKLLSDALATEIAEIPEF